MTIEIALLVAWGVLVSALIWRLNRVLKLLSEVRGEVSALRDSIPCISDAVELSD
jgi:hypothetical protein